MVFEKEALFGFLALGANDGLRGLDLTQSQKNLEEIITYAEEANATVLLAGMLIPPNYTLSTQSVLKKCMRNYTLNMR